MSCLASTTRGKVILYNVTVTFEADSIKTTDAYVGNIKPGETGNVDTMLTRCGSPLDEEQYASALITRMKTVFPQNPWKRS